MLEWAEELPVLILSQYVIAKLAVAVNKPKIRTIELTVVRLDLLKRDLK